MHCFTVVFVMSLAATTCVVASRAKCKYEEYEIIPDVIDEAPRGILGVTYEGGQRVYFGNILMPTQVRNRPKFSWHWERGALYTLIFVDADAPSRAEPTGRSVVHYVVGNIQGNDLNSGVENFGFIGSGPGQGSGLHRYIFLVYKQQGRIQFRDPPVPNTSPERRFNFSVRNFTADYRLGKPIAGNFYQSQYDDYVPILYRQLGIGR